MKFKVPKKKFIKGEVWTTKYKWNLRCDDGDPCWGLCDQPDRVIWLDRMTVEDEKLPVYLHEEGHALIHEMGIMLPEEIEEILVEAFARHFSKTYDMRPKKSK